MAGIFVTMGVAADDPVPEAAAAAVVDASNLGITSDKTEITTCETGVSAVDAFFILGYLGFSHVRVHDEAWVGWSRTKETKSDSSHHRSGGEQRLCADGRYREQVLIQV